MFVGPSLRYGRPHASVMSLPCISTEFPSATWYCSLQLFGILGFCKWNIKHHLKTIVFRDILAVVSHFSTFLFHTYVSFVMRWSCFQAVSVNTLRTYQLTCTLSQQCFLYCLQVFSATMLSIICAVSYKTTQ